MNLNDIDAKLQSIQQMKEDMILAEIYKSMPDFKVEGIKLREDGCILSWSCMIHEYEHADNSHIGYNDTISERVESINNRIDYVKQLWETYPEHCRISEKLKEYAYFSIPGVASKLQLTDHLTLPNAVRYQQSDTFYGGGSGFGGGDYEIKQAFRRAEKYIASADKLISILTESIAELQANKEDVLTMMHKPEPEKFIPSCGADLKYCELMEGTNENGAHCDYYAECKAAWERGCR